MTLDDKHVARRKQHVVPRRTIKSECWNLWGFPLMVNGWKQQHTSVSCGTIGAVPTPTTL